MTRRQHLACALALCAALVGEFGGHVWRAGFVYEDQRLLDGRSDHVKPAGLLRGRGLSGQSWEIIATPRAAHALNLALHATVALLLAALIAQLSGSAFLAWAGAAIFALHPLAIEGVAYAASRAELMAAIGVLLACLGAAGRSPWGWPLIPIGAVLGFAGKESAIVVFGLVPLVLMAQGRLRAWMVAGALLLAAGLAGGDYWLHGRSLVSWAAIGEYAGSHVGAGEWLLLQGAAAYRLLILSLAPFWLSVDPDLALVPLAGRAFALIALAGLAEAAWRLRRRQPLIAFGLAWSLLALAPRLIVRTPLAPLNEHQWYLPLMGIACGLAVAIERLAGRLSAPAFQEIGA